MNKLSAFALSAMVAAQAAAHSGHGMPTEIHWHATDAAGLAVVLLGALVAWWLAKDDE